MDTRDTILWDYDDTLGGIQFPDGSIHPGAAAYDDTIDRFVKYLSELFGFESAHIRQTQHDIDMVLAQTHGFSDKTRFAQSFRDTYIALDGTNEVVKDAVYAIGMSVFTDYKYVAMEGALDVLHTLSKFYRPVIVTKGETVEQWKKHNDSGIASFVDKEDVFVVGNKNVADWDSVLTTVFGERSESDIRECWAVGNSAKADVNPLVRLGFNGIHIAGKNGWAFETAELATPFPGQVCTVVTDIADVLDIIPHPHN